MPFADKFNEAAQNAAIRLIEADEWRGCGWLAKLVEQQVRLTLTQQAPTLDARNLTDEELEHMLTAGRRSDDFSNLSKRSEPVPYAFTQQTEELAEPEPQADTAELATNAGDHAFVSDDFTHVEGYDWRIIVADRLKNHANSWAKHFNYRPSQDEFEDQFRHFHARTHHVHANKWVDGDWTTITEEYVPHWNKEKPAETFTTTSDWEDGKGWRIKFWDQRVNRDNFVYFDYKPGGITLQKYHNGKQFAVVEQRPEGI